MKALRYIRQRMYRDILDNLGAINLEHQKKMDEQLGTLNDNERSLWEDTAQSITSYQSNECLFAVAGINPIPFSELVVHSTKPYVHGNYYSPIPSSEKSAEFDFNRELPDRLQT